MAKSSSPSCSAWKSVAPTAVSVSDDGDILQPLKRVRDKYIAKADELKEKAYGVNRVKILEAAANYESTADSVGRLIGLIGVSTLVEEPAPVDQTEEILSDIAEQSADDRNEMRLDSLDNAERLDDGDAIAAAVGEHDDTQA